MDTTFPTIGQMIMALFFSGYGNAEYNQSTATFIVSDVIIDEQGFSYLCPSEIPFIEAYKCFYDYMNVIEFNKKQEEQWMEEMKEEIDLEDLPF